jgi:hypothetical protein
VRATGIGEEQFQWVETNPSVFSLRTSVLSPPDGAMLMAFTDVNTVVADVR